MRIALAPEGTRGDVHPLLALGVELLERGHDVVLCGPPGCNADAERRGFGFHPVGLDPRRFLSEHADAVHGGAWKALSSSDAWFRSGLPLQFASLFDGTRGADLIIGAGTQTAGPSIAEARSIPYRYVAYCPAIFVSRHHPPFVVPNHDLPGWVNRTGWWLLNAFMNRKIGPIVNGLRAGLGLAPVRDLYPHMLTPEPLLAAEEQLAPVPPDVSVPFVRMPCLHPFEPEPLPAKLEDFLASGPPPVYVGFGSMTDPDPGRTTRVVVEAVLEAGCRAVISSGWAGLGDAALPPEVTRIGPTCHPSLFRRVSVVAHHGGAGTTTSAARAGVPQLVVPHLLDQFYWARRVTLLGLGPPPIPRLRLDRDALCQALRSLQDNDLVRERADELGRRLRARLPERGHCADALLRDLPDPEA